MPGTLGIQLTTSPESQDARTASEIARAALRQGRAVKFFVMCDGVHHLKEESFLQLAKEGVEIYICGHNAEERHLDEIEDIPNVHWGSQYDFAQMTAECDRILAFN